MKISAAVFITSLFLTVFLGFSNLAFARDVYIGSYYRSDGTYVRPHIRSSPNSYRWDNYGPSRSGSELLNPRNRDYDRDGTPNYVDQDDDNDSRHDDVDPSQYGRW